MSNTTKRAVLRSIHLIVSIPILGYIYGEASDVQQYAGAVRYVFFPIILLSGLWMWRGYVFAIIGVVLWVAAFRLSGFGTALLSQIALIIAWKIWSVMRARRSNSERADSSSPR